MSTVSTKRKEGDVREWKDNHLSPYRKVINRELSRTSLPPSETGEKTDEHDD